MQVVVVTFFILTFWGNRGERVYIFICTIFNNHFIEGEGGLVCFQYLQKNSKYLLTVVQQPVPKTLTNTKSKVKIIAYQNLER